MSSPGPTLSLREGGLTAVTWYPYGDFGYSIYLCLHLLRLGYMATLYGTFGMALWRLVGKRLRVLLPLAAVVVVAGMAGILPVPERYLLSISVVLSFIAISHAPFIRVALVLDRMPWLCGASQRNSSTQPRPCS